MKTLESIMEDMNIQVNDVFNKMETDIHKEINKQRNFAIKIIILTTIISIIVYYLIF